MPRKKTITYSQLRVGILILVALAIFLFTTIYITREGGLPLLGGQYTLHSYVGNVNGLKAGAPVHLSGVEVGSVTRVQFAEVGAPNPVKVTIKIRGDVQDRITSNSLLTHRRHPSYSSPGPSSQSSPGSTTPLPHVDRHPLVSNRHPSVHPRSPPVNSSRRLQQVSPARSVWSHCSVPSMYRFPHS